MSRKKILIIPSWYPTEDEPTFGIFFREQAFELNKKFDIAVLYIEEPIKFNELSKIFKKKIHILNDNTILTVNYKYVNWFPHCECLKIFLYRLAAIRGYLIIKKEFGKPDILHAHSTLMGGYGAIILKKCYNIPVIVSEHASFFDTFFSGSRKIIACEVFNNADKYTAVSKYLCELVKKKGRSQCDVIPNFINKMKFYSLTNSQMGTNQFKLLNVSSLIDLKGIDILIKALDIVINKNKIKNVNLDIVGKGPGEKKYQDLVKEFSLENYCTFHGEKSPEELSHFYHQTNVVVISSRSETFAIIGIEAMSVGKPIISTCCGGPEDYVTPDVGYLVENENPEKLAMGIIYVMNNYEKYSPQKIREIFLNNYSSDVVTEKWMEVYSKICDDRR